MVCTVETRYIFIVGCVPADFLLTNVMWLSLRKFQIQLESFSIIKESECQKILFCEPTPEVLENIGKFLPTLFVF